MSGAASHSRRACRQDTPVPAARWPLRTRLLRLFAHRVTARCLPQTAAISCSSRSWLTAEIRDCDVNGVGWDILIVLAIILIGGFFAAAEMALVSLREGQVRALAKQGKRGQRAARLAHDPNRFLSAVQIGVTVATLLSGAFGAA